MQWPAVFQPPGLTASECTVHRSIPTNLLPHPVGQAPAEAEGKTQKG